MTSVCTVCYHLELVKLLQFPLSHTKVVYQVLHQLMYNSAQPSIWAFVSKTNVVVLIDQDYTGERSKNFEYVPPPQHAAIVRLA